MTSIAVVKGPAWLRWLKARLDKLRQSFFVEFTLTFAVVALVVSLLAGLAVSSFLANDIRNKTLDDLAASVSQRASKVSLLTADQMGAPLSGAAFQEVDTFIRQSVLDQRTVRVNIWNREGTIVYSTSPELQGKTVAKPGVGAALAGETVAAVEDVETGVEGTGLEAYDQVIEVYAPLILAGSAEVTAAVEVYRDYTPVAAFISNIQRSVYIGIGVALAFVYLTMLFVVRRGSQTIRRQQKDIRASSLEIKSSYDSIVSVLCAALDLRDHVTHGHAQRVSELASVVAWQMGLRKEQVRLIEQAAILHDIGKIGVADAVLSKPGALTDDEWGEMRRHPELGYQILKDIEFLKDAAEIVYAHHERFDGKGYPCGLRGEAIPLGARVFAVVDTYDAMTSHRPYRKATSHHEAVEEITRHADTQFDPQVVRAFMEAERRGLIQGSPSAGDDVEAFFARVTRQGRRLSPAKGESQPPGPPEAV